MGMMQRIADFVTMRDHTSTRTLQGMDTRAAISGQLPSFVVGRPQWPRDNVIVMTRDGYYKAVTAFACINILADAVAEATLRVWENEGSGKKSDIPDHPLRLLLQRPNPDMSEAELLAHIVRTSALGGFCLIEKIRSERGNVVQLGFIRSDWAKPILRDQAPPDWEIHIPGRDPVILYAKDVIVYRYQDSPTLDPTGDTPMRAILREIGISNDLTAAVKLMLERGGAPSIALVVEPPKDGDVAAPLTDDDRAAIRQQWIARYGGVNNWAGPAVIEGLRIEQVSFDLNQMAFSALTDKVDLAVCRAFRVPHTIVQVMAGVSSSYGKLLEESMTMMQMYTARPIRTRLDGALSRGLLPEFDTRPNIDLGFDESDVPALQEDEDAIHSRIRADFDAGGLTWDEFRMHIGEEPWNNELGSSVKLAFSTIPTPIDAPAVPPATTPTGDDATRAEVLPETRAAETSLVKMHRTVMDAMAFQLAPLVGTYLAEQHRRIKEQLGVMQRSGPIDRRDALPIDWMSEEEFLRSVYEQWYELVFGEVAAINSEFLGVTVDWNGRLPYLSSVRNVIGERVGMVTEETRKQLEAIVQDVWQSGGSSKDVAEAIDGLFEQTYKNRHITIARTESQVAVNTAAGLSYEEAGVEEVRIYDNPNCDHTRGSDGYTCKERNGLVVPVTDMQKHIAGEHPNGSLSFGPIVKPLNEDGSIG